MEREVCLCSLTNFRTGQSWLARTRYKQEPNGLGDGHRDPQQIPTAKFWGPVHRNLILQACMVAANTLWQTIFIRLLRHLLSCPETGGCKLYMPRAANSVKCTFSNAESEA